MLLVIALVRETFDIQWFKSLFNEQNTAYCVFTHTYYTIFTNLHEFTIVPLRYPALFGVAFRFVSVINICRKFHLIDATDNTAYMQPLSSFVLSHMRLFLFVVLQNRLVLRLSNYFLQRQKWYHCLMFVILLFHEISSYLLKKRWLSCCLSWFFRMESNILRCLLGLIHHYRDFLIFWTNAHLYQNSILLLLLWPKCENNNRLEKQCKNFCC